MNVKRHQKVDVLINNSSRHDLSHQHLTTIDFFRLQPIGIMECVAGDKISLNVRSLLDAAPMATKVYGSCHLDIHAFFVPFRLLWAQWNNYYYGDGSDTSLSLPYVRGVSSLFDDETAVGDAVRVRQRRKVFGSLGYPTSNVAFIKGTYSRPLSVLPARAYQRIWWDWFRDSVNILERNKASYIYDVGGDRSTSSDLIPTFEPRYRTFRKDYITTLLSSQSAAVEGDAATTEGELISRIDGSVNGYQGFPAYVGEEKGFAQGSSGFGASNSRHILTSLRIPALRAAAGLQRLLERLGVSGTRPLERIRSTFGMNPKPERLDMTEFIGFKSIPVGIDGLINTGSSTPLNGGNNSNAFTLGSEDSPAFCQMAGRSSSAGQSDTWQYHAEEHGYIMVIASVIPDYINGAVIDPLFSRGLSPASQGPLDFYQPDMDGTGYRPVTLGQIIAPLGENAAWGDTSNVDFDAIVGYQPYAEDYRFIFDRISGDFNEEQSKNVLRNMAFVREIPETLAPSAVVAGLNLTTPTFNDVASFDNHFQVTDGSLDHFILNNYFVIDAIRPVTSAELPTELSDMANRTMAQVDKGGMRN